MEVGLVNQNKVVHQQRRLSTNGQVQRLDASHSDKQVSPHSMYEQPMLLFLCHYHYSSVPMTFTEKGYKLEVAV